MPCLAHTVFQWDIKEKHECPCSALREIRSFTDNVLRSKHVSEKNLRAVSDDIIRRACDMLLKEGKKPNRRNCCKSIWAEIEGSGTPKTSPCVMNCSPLEGSPKYSKKSNKSVKTTPQTVEHKGCENSQSLSSPPKTKGNPISRPMPCMINSTPREGPPGISNKSTKVLNDTTVYKSGGNNKSLPTLPITKGKPISKTVSGMMTSTPQGKSPASKGTSDKSVNVQNETTVNKIGENRKSLAATSKILPEKTKGNRVPKPTSTRMSCSPQDETPRFGTRSNRSVKVNVTPVDKRDGKSKLLVSEALPLKTKSNPLSKRPQSKMNYSVEKNKVDATLDRSDGNEKLRVPPKPVLSSKAILQKGQSAPKTTKNAPVVRSKQIFGKGGSSSVKEHLKPKVEELISRSVEASRGEFAYVICVPLSKKRDATKEPQCSAAESEKPDNVSPTSASDDADKKVIEAVNDEEIVPFSDKTYNKYNPDYIQDKEDFQARGQGSSFQVDKNKPIEFHHLTATSSTIKPAYEEADEEELAVVNVKQPMTSPGEKFDKYILQDFASCVTDSVSTGVSLDYTVDDVMSVCDSNVTVPGEKAPQRKYSANVTDRLSIRRDAKKAGNQLNGIAQEMESLKTEIGNIRGIIDRLKSNVPVLQYMVCFDDEYCWDYM